MPVTNKAYFLPIVKCLASQIAWQCWLEGTGAVFTPPPQEEPAFCSLDHFQYAELG